MGPNTTEGCASNSAVGKSSLPLPKTLGVGKLGVVDRWRVGYPSVVVTEVGG